MLSTKYVGILIICGMVWFSCAAFEINQATIDAGFIITQPGEWFLTESVVVRETIGITIQGDNVVLNLNGNTMQSQGADHGIVVEAVHSCSIKNGTLEGFGAEAIVVTNVAYMQIADLIIDNSYGGIQIREASDIELMHVAIASSTDTALSIIDSSYVSIGGCFIKDVGKSGIIIQGQSDGISLQTIYINRCQSTGLIIGSDGVQLSNVFVQNGDGDGIVINSNAVTCNGVISAYNKGSGIIIGGADTQIRNCMASHNGGDGVMLKKSAHGVTIMAGRYAVNGSIGINNQGFSDNKISYVQVFDNKQRNLYHIVSNVMI